MFEMISKEEREFLEKEMVELVIEQFQKENVEEDYFCYEVKLQNTLFRVVMNDDELKLAAVYAIDLLEEFKRINNSGVCKAKFEEVVNNVKEELVDTSDNFKRIFTSVKVMDKIATEKISEIKRSIAELCRVGGTYWLLISNPYLVRVLYAVYENMVDKFDSDELYNTAAYFLLRVIMRIGAEE